MKNDSILIESSFLFLFLFFFLYFKFLVLKYTLFFFFNWNVIFLFLFWYLIDVCCIVVIFWCIFFSVSILFMIDCADLFSLDDSNRLKSLSKFAKNDAIFVVSDYLKLKANCVIDKKDTQLFWALLI